MNDMRARLREARLMITRTALRENMALPEGVIARPIEDDPRSLKR